MISVVVCTPNFNRELQGRGYLRKDNMHTYQPNMRNNRNRHCYLHHHSSFLVEVVGHTSKLCQTGERNWNKSPYWLLWCITTASVWWLLRSVSLSAVCLWWRWADLRSVEKVYIRLYIRIVTTLLTTLVVILYCLRYRNAYNGYSRRLRTFY